MKNKASAWICVAAIALAAGGLIGGAFGIENSHNKDSQSPLGWCVREITKHEGYDGTDYSFTYEIPKLPEGERTEPNAYRYAITMHTDERVGLWLCSIECVCSHALYKTLHLGGGMAFQPNEVKSIDCDLAYEIAIGKDIVYE